MFKSVLRDERLKEGIFVCKGGPTISVSAEALRKILPQLHDHFGGAIWGPFTLDPAASTIDGHQVEMTVS